jgi:hypothetical protein
LVDRDDQHLDEGDPVRGSPRPSSFKKPRLCGVEDSGAGPLEKKMSLKFSGAIWNGWDMSAEDWEAQAAKLDAGADEEDAVISESEQGYMDADESSEEDEEAAAAAARQLPQAERDEMDERELEEGCDWIMIAR